MVESGLYKYYCPVCGASSFSEKDVAWICGHCGVYAVKEGSTEIIKYVMITRSEEYTDSKPNKVRTVRNWIEVYGQWKRGEITSKEALTALDPKIREIIKDMVDNELSGGPVMKNKSTFKRKS